MFPNQDPMEVAFEDLCSRFDRYLQRLRANGDTQRGLLILDKSAHETTLQQMSVGFRIAHKFDAEDGIIHGLVHKEFGNPNCMCIACVSRRAGEARQS